MKKLITYSTRRPISVLMSFCLVLLLGAVAPFLLNVRFLPEAKDRFIVVQADYKGARAKEIRRLISIPLEENLSALKGIKNIESVSRDGLALVQIELKWNTDCDNALLETKALLDSCMDFLPQDCPKPLAQKKGEPDDSAIKIIVVPKNGDIAQAGDFVQNELKRRLLSIEEAASSKTYGSVQTEIKVVVDPALSSYYGLSLQDIAETLSLSNFDYPAGTLKDGQNEILLKTEGSFKNFDDILDTSLKTNQGQLKLRHLARVKKAERAFDSFCLYNGERCAELLVFCKKNHNPLALSKKVRKLLNEMKTQDKAFDFIIESDSAKDISRSLIALAANAAIGTLIAFILLRAYFGSARIALSIAAAIPLGLFFTAAVLFALKRSLNIISLSGMTICLGMTIDNGIVAIESAMQAKDLREGFFSARLSNFASTVTSAIVFVPLFFIGGIIGELFLDLAISVISALCLSLAYSWTVLPALCVLFLKKDLASAKTLDLSKIENKIRGLLKKTDKIKALCPALTLSFFVLTAILFLPMKKEFQPKKKELFFTEQIFFKSGSDAALMASQTKAICERILELGGVKSVLARGGFEKNDRDFFADPENKKECASLKIACSNIQKTRTALKEILDSQGIEHARQESKDIVSERLELSDKTLFCSDTEEAVYAECKEFFGEENFYPHEISEQKNFIANKKLMEKLDISPAKLSASLRHSFDGASASSYYENGKEIPIIVQFNEMECAAENKLDSLKIILGRAPVQLSLLGEWKTQKEEAALYRRNGKDAKIIRKSGKNNFPPKIKKRLLSTKKESLRDLFINGSILLLLAQGMLYCILGAQTESLRRPIFYLSAVPPSFFGAALTLFIFGSSLNINSIIAFTLLFGTSVNNAIILLESGGKRMSTVFITTATSIAPLLPFAFDPLGLNPQSSLSLAVAGGLFFSAAAVLVMAPNILHWSAK